MSPSMRSASLNASRIMSRCSRCSLVGGTGCLGRPRGRPPIRAGLIERDSDAGRDREQFPTRGDKAVRAQSVRGKMAMDGLYVPSHAPWYPDFRAELLSFPFGKHDDQVDAIGLFGQLLDKVLAGQKPKPPLAPEKHDDYQAAINDDYGSFLTM
jgi:hypothetical protein